MTSIRIEGGGSPDAAYTTVDYVRGVDWEPCAEQDADRAIVREYDAADHMIIESIDVLDSAPA